MRKPTHKAQILTEDFRVVHERGYSASSVRNIVQAAGVPHRSFTSHFATKKAFGLEILNLFYEQIQENSALNIFLSESLIKGVIGLRAAT